MSTDEHDHHHSNQGSCSIERVLDDLSPGVRQAAAKAGWKEIKGHVIEVGTASCECVVIEILCVLYDNGYTVVREGQEFRT